MIRKLAATVLTLGCLTLLLGGLTLLPGCEARGDTEDDTARVQSAGRMPVDLPAAGFRTAAVARDRV